VTLVWNRISRQELRTACGRYRITSSLECRDGSRTLYTATHGAREHIGSISADTDDAGERAAAVEVLKADCAAHAARVAAEALAAEAEAIERVRRERA
jgi:hypothetical protein